MTVVYFMAHRASGRIKIGYTKDLNARLRTIANSTGKIRLLGHVDGGRTLEARIHDVLGEHRISGEWFRDCPELRETIGNVLRDGPKSAIGFDEAVPVPNPKLFGRVAKTVWPHKTAAHLAAATGASVRAAEYWIGGQREPSARAVQAIFNEITRA
jgi:hypothetical protein